MTTARRISLAVLALATLGTQAGAVQLRHKFGAGEAHTYRVTGESRTITEHRGAAKTAATPQAVGHENSYNILATQKVLSTARDTRSARIERHLKSGEMMRIVAGKTRTVELLRDSVVMSVSDRGKVLHVKRRTTRGEEIPGSSLLFLGFGSDWSPFVAAMAFPGRDVKVNDTWDTAATLKLQGGGTAKVKARSRLLKLVAYRGRPCARIRTWFEIPLDGSTALADMAAQLTSGGKVTGKMTGLVISHFDHARGVVMDQEIRITSSLRTSFERDGKPAETLGTTTCHIRSVMVK